MTRREKAIRRRRRFILSVLLVILIIVGIIVSIVSCNKKSDENSSKTKSDISSTSSISSVQSDVSSQNGSDNSSSAPEQIIDSSPEQIMERVENLDPSFTVMTLVNGNNPLPDNYDSEVRKDLVEIEPELRNNNYVTKIHKYVYPYITEMVRKAQADGVDLKVWSPFRSYADQQALFNKQVARVGGDENLAATVVARPGTSEHNTGYCADFNMADDAFEKTPMYDWMCKNAENYGFILRYPKSKQEKTGVIYESWHWRFVGINMAKKINKTGLCLEEYIEKYGNNKY